MRPSRSASAAVDVTSDLSPRAGRAQVFFSSAHFTISNMTEHLHHTHRHGQGCGHTAVVHNGHVDYLHDGHLHHQDGDTVVEHQLEVSSDFPADCTPDHKCGGHDSAHSHGPGCGHAAIPHGDHVDYLVDGHLHHPHGSHCDFHGAIATVA